MKKSLFFLLFPLLLSACTVILTIPESKRQNDINIGVDWAFDSSDVSNTIKNSIDSVITLAITDFNNEDLSYTLHKKNSGDSACIKLIFDKSIFATRGKSQLVIL